MISVMVEKATIALPTPLNLLSSADQRILHLAAGVRVFSQGDVTRGMYYICEGRVNLVRHTEEGHEILIHRATAGTTFAEASLFSEKYHCDASVIIDAVVIECSRSSLLALYEKESGFALAMSERFSHQIQHARRHIEILSIRNAQERVYRALVEGLLVGSVNTLADEIGLSPETVYRSLASLVRSGRIDKLGYGRYAALRD